MTSSVSPRAQQLLKHLVEIYLRDGTPVGSKTLTQYMVPSLSSATVRKVLHDLESAGFIHSPHTSAGRVPTSRGLRFFVDKLSQVHPIQGDIVQTVEQQIDRLQPTDNVITQVSNILSEMTHMVGIVTLPTCEQLILRHVEFVPLGDNRILAVLVLNDRDIQNRIIETEKPLKAYELEQASNFLNQHFAGKDLLKARDNLLSELNVDRTEVDRLMKTVIEVAGKAFDSQTSGAQNYVLAGQEKLLLGDTPNIEQLQKIFSAFTQKQQILHLLNQCINADGIQLFIGDEWAGGAFESYSVITSRYQYNGDNVGVLGVIGPTRMPYQHVIPVVDLAAKLLSSALKS